jgi:hypothetical protein
MTRMIVVLSLIALFLGGCAFGGYSRADLHKTRPSFSPGAGKSQIVEMLGPPDKYVEIENVEYLTYKAKRGFFVLLIGQTKANDFEVKLTDGKFTSARWIPSGSSIGIFAPQGSVAE